MGMTNLQAHYAKNAAGLAKMLAKAETTGRKVGGYTADKNANTSRFAAESSAWNAAQSNADQNRYRMGSLAWEMNKPQGAGRTVSSGMTIPNGTLGGIGGTWDPEKDPGIARLRQSSIDAYNY